MNVHVTSNTNHIRISGFTFKPNIIKRGACDTSGDALGWLTHYRRLSFVEALRVLSEWVENIAPLERKCLKSASKPPEWDWQHRAECIVSQAEETLWSDMGERPEVTP